MPFHCIISGVQKYSPAELGRDEVAVRSILCGIRVHQADELLAAVLVLRVQLQLGKHRVQPRQQRTIKGIVVGQQQRGVWHLLEALERIHVSGRGGLLGHAGCRHAAGRARREALRVLERGGANALQRTQIRILHLLPPVPRQRGRVQRVGIEGRILRLLLRGLCVAAERKQILARRMQNGKAIKQTCIVLIASIRLAIICHRKLVILLKVEAVVPKVQLLRRVHGTHKQRHGAGRARGNAC